MIEKVDKRLIAALFLLAVLVRLVALFVLPTPPLDESAQAAYLAGANKLISGNGFQDTSYPVYAPPLYGMFIASCQIVFGDNLIVVKAIQCVLDSITVVLVFFIMREIFSVHCAIAAAVILAVYPFSVYLAISIASEPLTTFLLAVFALLCIHALRVQEVRHFVTAGAVLGLVTLTRATTQFMPLLFWLMLIPFFNHVMKIMLMYIAFILSFLLIIAPWTIRNYKVIDDFIPVATGGGIVLLMGSHEEYLVIPGKPAMLKKYPPQGGKPSEIDRYFRNAAIAEHIDHMNNDPPGFIKFAFVKLLRMWYATESGYNHKWILAVNLPIYCFASLGLVIALRRGRVLAIIPLFILSYYIALHWISLPLFRYMMPVMPYVIGFASFGICELACQSRLSYRLTMLRKFKRDV